MRLTIMPLLFAVATTAAAQTPPPAQPAPDRAPDVAIVTNVRAREVRFADKPQVHVEVSGDVNGRPAAVVSRTDRQNLPNEVQPYVTYRDIGILLTITSTLPDIEKILDDALDTTPPESEVPAPTPPATKRGTRKKSRH